MAIYVLCAAAFGCLEQLLDSYRRAAEQLQNTATRFNDRHSVSTARCNLTFAAKRLQDAANRLQIRCSAMSQRFCGAAQRCSFCTRSIKSSLYFSF